MVEAAAESLSPVATWVMCIVMSLLAAFMVSATLVADSYQQRMIRRYRQARGIEPAPGAGLAAGSVPGPRAGGAVLPPGGTPTLVDLPAQRAGDASEAATHGYAAQGTAEEEPGR